MKRSDALNRMVDFYLANDLHRASLRERMDRLLSFQEVVLGMLPPLQENMDMYTEPFVWESEEDAVAELIAQDAVWIPHET